MSSPSTPTSSLPSISNSSDTTLIIGSISCCILFAVIFSVSSMILSLFKRIFVSLAIWFDTCCFELVISMYDKSSERHSSLSSLPSFCLHVDSFSSSSLSRSCSAPPLGMRPNDGSAYPFCSVSYFKRNGRRSCINLHDMHFLLKGYKLFIFAVLSAKSDTIITTKVGIDI